MSISSTWRAAKSTLFVSPSGQSMLVDTGFPGTRDADRIANVAKHAGLAQIDFLLITHYHGDHVGGVPELAKKLPIKTFIDHGLPMEETQVTSPKITRRISRFATRTTTNTFWQSPAKSFPSRALT